MKSSVFKGLQKLYIQIRSKRNFVH